MARSSLAALLLLAFAAAPAAAVPNREVHDLDWFVHKCLVDDQGGGATGLAFWSSFLAERLAESDRILQGAQGPADTPCCVSLEPVSVSEFGTCAGGVDTDGLNLIETSTELDQVLGPGAASGAYLVDMVHYCTSFSTSIRGCANQPGTKLVVGREAEDSDFFPTVTAHERGHNAGLSHVGANLCQLMAASSGGGCLSVSECNAFIAKADTTSGSCACLGNNVGDPPLADGTSCMDGFGCQACSGGLCDTCWEGSLSQLIASDTAPASSDEAIEQSFLSGDWTSLGSFGTGVEVTALAYDAATGTLYGAETNGSGDDNLITISPTTGARLSTVGPITMALGQSLADSNIVALAFDPDNGVLWGIHIDDDVFGNPFGCGGTPCVPSLVEIDPADGSGIERGEFNSFLGGNAIPGLAYDDQRDILYGSSPFSMAGLVDLDTTSCNGTSDTSCSLTTIATVEPASVSSLTYDPTSDKLVRMAQGVFVGSLEMTEIDPASLEENYVRGVDAFEAGGLAVVPVPEPGLGLQLAAGAAFLAAAARRRRGAR